LVHSLVGVVVGRRSSVADVVVVVVRDRVRGKTSSVRPLVVSGFRV